ncbi:SPW repeat domain-containing protein [Halostagnicola kamekurae]|uniref:SPW repeat-containing protein n=1 Tax=Halostagnicola kamekurae TaxID=619731 RepID=A0A1I6SMD4_9EURY|nr:SPW repeat protein [Halostagnicola kamekurae]SFS78030.1 SPW repeat-containing protein [Halostagnicola kamekurae]
MSTTPTDSDSTRGDEHGQNTLNTDMMQWVSALAALVGLYLVASPFLFEATNAAVWNDTLVGTAIFLLAGYNFVRMSRDRLASVGVASLTVLLGLWALVSPALVEMGSGQLATGTALSGLVVAILAGYTAYANNSADMPERARTRA